jgi:hypothetical protein
LHWLVASFYRTPTIIGKKLSDSGPDEGMIKPHHSQMFCAHLSMNALLHKTVTPVKSQRSRSDEQNTSTSLFHLRMHCTAS